MGVGVKLIDAAARIVSFDYASFRDGLLTVNLWYPRSDNGNEVQEVEIELMDVRAADSIRVSYDFKRDGYVIKQASIFEWDADDEECESDWQEVAFVKAWAREVETR